MTHAPVIAVFGACEVTGGVAVRVCGYLTDASSGVPQAVASSFEGYEGETGRERAGRVSALYPRTPGGFRDPKSGPIGV